ncbi:MAG TPA: hypothetical protein VGV91_20975 [Rubrobacter sp.]|nr:hypothetical protein [Rubrobacter sp.]
MKATAATGAYLGSTTMRLAALAMALVSLLVACAPALAQRSTVADTGNPRVVDVRFPDGATDVSIVSPNQIIADFRVDERRV